VTSSGDTGVAAARAALRDDQRLARERLGVTRPIASGDALAQALAHAERREHTGEVRGEHVRVGPFRYALATERQRWARTREIVQRVAPGRDEDARQLEMVARQAAAVEIVLRGECGGAADPRLQALCDRLLLGTLPSFDLAASSRRHGDHYLVLVSAGLIDFTYQLAKATLLSWKPVASRPGSFLCERADVEAMLEQTPLPLGLLRTTIEHYLFHGVPRAPDAPAPPPHIHPPLDTLTAFNERFVIAHEIAHALHEDLDIVHAGMGARGEEFAADVWALRWTMESAHLLDDMAPNVAAQGAFFTLTVLDVLHQALDLARHGEVRTGARFAGHPPTEQRLDTLREAYRELVTREDDNLSLRAALFPAETLSLMWQRLLGDGSTASWPRRRLHASWRERP
jgi:hypothetical protein